MRSGAYLLNGHVIVCSLPADAKTSSIISASCTGPRRRQFSDSSASAALVFRIHTRYAYACEWHLFSEIHDAVLPTRTRKSQSYVMPRPISWISTLRLEAKAMRGRTFLIRVLLNNRWVFVSDSSW